jgi:hypothetical protein
MATLRFVKLWGPYKVGDIKNTDSACTVHYLTKVYKVAVAEGAASPRPYVAPSFTLPPEKDAGMEDRNSGKKAAAKKSFPAKKPEGRKK